MTAPWTQRERALYEALEATPCRCSKAIKNACPTCGETLVAVRYSGYLNSDQWDAIKGGDWYCNTCTDPSIVNGKKHWHDRELETITYQQCSRCAALADPPPPDLRAALVEAKKALWDYRSAQRRMLDKWAEGDDNVRRDLWQNLHKCESAADSAIASIDAVLEAPRET